MNSCIKCNTVIETNSIQCLLCETWAHLGCATFIGQDDDDFFVCEKCEKGLKFHVPGVLTINDDKNEKTVSYENVEKERICQETEKPTVSKNNENVMVCEEFEVNIKTQCEQTHKEIISRETEFNVEDVLLQETEEIVSVESTGEIKISQQEEAIIASDEKHSSLKIKVSRVKGNQYRIVNFQNDTNNNDPQIHTDNNELQINELLISDKNELPIYDNNELPISGEKIQNESNNKSLKRKANRTSGPKKKVEKKNTLAQQAELGEVYFSTHIKSEVNHELNHTIYSCQTCIKFKPTIHVLKAKKHAFKHEEMAKSVGGKKQKSAKKNGEKKEKWICSSCDFKSTKKSDLIKHTKQAHPTVSSDICSHCGQSFVDYKTLKRHIQLVHLGIKNIACNLCPFKCRDTYDLNRHIKNNHEPKVKVNNNNTIESSVVNVNNVNKDGISTNVEPKEFTMHCQYCDKGFYDTIKLNRHLKGHTGDNLPKCEECDKTFRDNFNLKKHMKKHNKIVLKYACNFCSKTFARENKLLNHVRKDHKKYINPDNVNQQIMDPVHVQDDIQELNPEFVVTGNEMAGDVHNIIELNHNELIVNDKSSHLSNLSLDNTIALYLDVIESGSSAPFVIPHFNNENMSNVDIDQSTQSVLLDTPLHDIPNDKDSNVLINDIQIFNVSELNETKLEEDRNTVNNVVCEFCDNVFAQNYNLIRHIQDVHNQEIIKCKKCHITFKGKESFLNHRPCKWTCTSCNKVFLKYPSYIYHKQNKHSD